MATYVTPEGQKYSIPEEGEVFRIKDSPTGGIAIRSGNQLLETDLEKLGTKLFTPTAANPTYDTLTPAQRQALGTQYLSQQGIDYNTISEGDYLLPDLYEAFRRLGGHSELTDYSLLKSTPKTQGETITATVGSQNPQGVDIMSSTQGELLKTPSIQENLAAIPPEQTTSTTPPTTLTPEQQTAYYASEGNKPNPLSPADWLKQQGGGAAPTGATPTPSPVLTPEQQKAYYASEGNKPNPLSPLDWLKQQSAGAPASVAPGTTAPAASPPATTYVPAPAPAPAGGTKAPGSVQVVVDTRKEIAQIDAAVNAAAQQEVITITNETTPTVRESSKLLEKLADVFSTEKAPAPPSLAQTFQEQRAALGVGEFETRLSDIDGKLAQLDADYSSVLEEEEGRLVSMGAIQRRQSALGIEYNRQKRDLIAERDSVARILDVKYGIINTMVNLTGQDYANASQAYQVKFNQAITLFNAFRGVEQDQISDLQRKEDVARANVQIMANLLKQSNVDFTTLSPATQLEIRKAETQAGFPIGFIAAVTKAAKATNSTEVQFLPAFTDASGARIQPVVLTDSKGGYSISNVTLGQTETKAAAQSEVQFLPPYTNTAGNRIQPVAVKNPNGSYSITETVLGQAELPAGGAAGETPGGGTPSGGAGGGQQVSDFAKARQYITDNPKASENTIRSYLQENTKLNESEITTLLKEKAESTTIVITKDYIKSLFTEDELKAAAKASGFTRGGWGPFNTGVGPEGVDDYLNWVMEDVERKRKLGMKDNEIAKEKFGK